MFLSLQTLYNTYNVLLITFNQNLSENEPQVRSTTKYYFNINPS